MSNEYEYIVVGSGAGGGPLAANLALAGHRVLLLEAGGTEEPYDYQVPAFHPFASENPEMSWAFFVRHYDDQKQQARDWKFRPDQGGVFYPRAATLGGCTAHNAMILVYPDNSDWDGIARLPGDASWRVTAMRAYYQRLEDCRYRPWWQRFARWLGWNPSRHGFGDGWLTTSAADPKLALQDEEMLAIVKRAARSALFGIGDLIKRILLFPWTFADPNDWRSVARRAEGLRLTPLTVKDGQRLGARERVLAARAAVPDRLILRTGALVTRVLFDDQNRAIGVEYLDGSGLYQASAGRAEPAERRADAPRVQVYASREVILAGGAFNTPQLLQLSGIGPAALLEKHGIPLRLDRPGVGANLQDRYEVSVVHKMKRPFSMLEGATMRPPAPGQPPDPHFEQWQRERKGVYTTNGAVISIIKRSRPEALDPDLFIFGLATDFRGYFPGYAELIGTPPFDKFTWAVLKGHTTNTEGSVTIRSDDPCDTPDIRFRYFEEGNGDAHDLEAVVDAVQSIRGIAERYGDAVAEEIQPGPQVNSRDQLRTFVRDQAWGHHASCTCKIGTPDDPMAVLDSQFRVYGTEGLRVVDASVFPTIPGLFIVSAVYMVAEKASDVILADARNSLDQA